MKFDSLRCFMKCAGRSDVVEHLAVAGQRPVVLAADGLGIVGCGTHSTLLHSCETYREIALSQLSAAELGEEG